MAVKMLKFKTKFLIMILAVSLAGTTLMGGEVKRSSIRIENLKCEYQKNPLGIDEAAPRLSWQLNSDERGQRQTAYRILVAENRSDLERDQGEVWDTEKVSSHQSIQVSFGGRPLESGRRYYWKVQIWDRDGYLSSWSEPGWWEMGLLNSKDWTGQWIGDGKSDPERDEDFYQDDPAPLFRQEFDIKKPVRRARLYIAGLGYYKATLDGNPIGDQALAPAWTAYDKRIYYSCFDLKGPLQPGQHCLGVALGNGWYNPLPLRLFGRFNLREHLAVGRPRFIAQLAIEYTDGSKQTIVSDTRWRMKEGPVLRNNIYLGEVYDARSEQTGWDLPGFDISGWSSAVSVDPPAGRLQARPVPPICISATLNAQQILHPAEGVTIFDLGQNFTGWIRLNLQAQPGARIQLRYGELLHKDGTLNPMTSVCGQLKGMRKGPDGKELPAGGPGAPPVAWQADTYIARGGGLETYESQFTFHGFRYVEMTGYTGPVTLDMIQGKHLHTAVEPVGQFQCSNELVNRIQTMCEWTFRNNLISVQSDCPHRERLGYGGDIVVTSDAMMLNFDMAQFYTKAAWDWHDAARPDGMLTDTAPFIGIQYCGPAWAMAHPLLQAQLYRYYGDWRIIERQYGTSKRWFKLVQDQAKDGIFPTGLSDHEARVGAEPPMLVTPLYSEAARIMSSLAEISGQDRDRVEYLNLAEQIKSAYLEKYNKPETGVFSPGSQTSQSFALYLDMAPVAGRDRAFDYLVNDLVATNEGKLTTGIFGTQFMLDVLSRMGRADLAWQLATRREFPGWGYMLENGATTLWEHWQYSDNTYSHNHPMFGSVSQWFYNWLGGIQPARDAVGFNKIEFRPQFIQDLDWVQCRYQSIRGPIESNWRRKDNSIYLTLEIPVQAQALLYLPVPSATVVHESRLSLDKIPGIVSVQTGDNQVVCQLQSGRYELIIQQ